MPIKYWGHLTTGEFSGLDPARTVALLPVGAVEQHGPHLPLATDIMITEAVLGEAGRQLAEGPFAEEVTLLILPSGAIGLSPEHTGFAGTLTHRAETLIAAWSEIGRSVAAAGLRKLVFLNSHGGQPQIVDIVTQHLRTECGMLAVRANSFRFDLPGEMTGPGSAISEEERRFGLHGGQIETALMLAIAPELVRMEAIADFPNAARALAETGARLGLSGAGGFAWNAEDLNPGGATGNAARATAAQGHALLLAYGAQLASLLRNVAAWPLKNGAPFASAPSSNTNLAFNTDQVNG